MNNKIIENFKLKLMSFLMIIIMVFVVVMPVETLAAGKVNKNAGKKITIMSINDFHGAILEESKNPGLSKVTTKLTEIKNENPDTIFVSAGDNYQGTAMSNLLFGQPISDFFKTIKFEGSAIGNHEFDWGLEKIQEWGKSIDYLAANVYDKKTDEVVDFAKPYKIVKVDGVNIGLIGISTPETSFKTTIKNVQGLEFKDPIEISNKYAKELKDSKKADLVVIVGHLGAFQDEKTKEITGEAAELAKRAENIDAIICGHTHQPVSGKINNIPIMQAAHSGRNLGKLTLELDKDKKIVNASTELVNMTEEKANLKGDKTVEKIVKQYEGDIKPLLDTVVGKTDMELPHDRFKIEGTSTLGYWAAKSMAESVGAQVGLLNGGGVRVPIEKGEITKGVLYRVMPFDNTIVSLDLTGAHLKKVVENAIMNQEIGWGQVYGLKAYYDKEKPKGERISAMFLSDGSKIEDSKEYKIATVDFMVSGGDNYDFSGAKNIVDTNVPIRNALEKALEGTKEKPLNFEFEQTLISGQAPVKNIKGNQTESIFEQNAVISIGVLVVMLGIVLLFNSKRKINKSA